MPSHAAWRLKEESCGSILLRDSSGTEYQWYKDGTVYCCEADKTKIIFPARPTHTVFLNGSLGFADFFLRNLSFQRYTHGNYIEFCSNGTVVYRRNGVTFHWSKDFLGKEMEGELSSTTIMTDDDFWMSERRDSYS
jgi:hypothetical protein